MTPDELYERAGEAARQIITLIKMAEEQGLADDSHIRGIVRQHMRDYDQPRQSWALVEVLARAVADSFEDLDEFSAHVIASLAADGDDK